MLGSASYGSSGQPSMECAGFLHTARADAARDSNVDDDDGVSIFVNADVGVSIADTSGDFDLWRDDQLSHVLDPVLTTSAVFLCLHLLPNCFSSGLVSGM